MWASSNNLKDEAVRLGWWSELWVVGHILAFRRIGRVYRKAARRTRRGRGMHHGGHARSVVNTELAPHGRGHGGNQRAAQSLHEMQIQAAWLHEEEEGGEGVVAILLSCLLSLFGVGRSGLLGSMAWLSQNLKIERRKFLLNGGIYGFSDVVNVNCFCAVSVCSELAVKTPEVCLLGKFASALAFDVFSDVVLN
jgi:hypothetical protein